LYEPVGSCRTRSTLRETCRSSSSPIYRPASHARSRRPHRQPPSITTFSVYGARRAGPRGPEGVGPRNRRQWRGSTKTAIYCSWLEHIRMPRRVIGSYHCRPGALVWKSPFRIAARRPSARLRLRPMPRRGSLSTRTASRHKAREPAGSAGRGREPIRQPDDRESRAIMIMRLGGRLELRRLPLSPSELRECADGL
jgi:hypothetical protein